MSLGTTVSPPKPAVHRNTTCRVEFSGVGRTFEGARAAKGEALGHVAVREVGIDVRPGEVVAILGASGCGKSTLLRIAGGLDRPTTGEVRIDGASVAPFDPRCAIAFQEPRLLPWRTVAANVELGLPAGLSPADGGSRVRELLELVGLTRFAGHRPGEVSGGMAQRTALARALARNPGLLLLDEPFASLDALTRMRMQDLLLEVLEAAPTTVLLVTHDVDEALQLAERVLVLGPEPGREGSTIRQVREVPGAKPRDRGSAELAELRAELLAALGIDRHAH